MEELFDLPHEYDAMLNRSLSLSGESKNYFIKGRLQDITLQLKAHPPVQRILDFGCGIGDGTAALLDFFPQSVEIIGADLSRETIFFARNRHKNDKLKFIHLSELNSPDQFDLCFVNGVFHHIEPDKRDEALKIIYKSLHTEGILALCENNPYNPGTLFIMSRNPFDRDAKTISYFNCEKIIQKAGFSKILCTRFLFYFPSFLAFLRPLESLMVNLPFGGQYYVLARK
jgi:SAM-dependent methyltransferase